MCGTSLCLSNAAALEKNSTPGEVVEKNLGHRKSVEDLRSIINTSLTARRWQSKTVSKALPALAPFVPRMLRDDLLTAQPRCLAGSAGHTSHPEQPDEDNDSKSADSLWHCLCCDWLTINNTVPC